MSWQVWVVCTEFKFCTNQQDFKFHCNKYFLKAFPDAKKREKNQKQAGAELDQAQLKLDLDFPSIRMWCIDDCEVLSTNTYP